MSLFYLSVVGLVSRMFIDISVSCNFLFQGVNMIVQLIGN